MLEIRLLGRFDVSHDGKPVIISSRAAQSLFAYLTLNAGISHRREKLAGMFWPEVSEEKARAYLRRELWQIRNALPHESNIEYLLADSINVSFNKSADYSLDVTALASQSSSIQELIATLSVYQGDFLPGFYDEWIIMKRAHLQTLYEQNIARLLQFLERENRWDEMPEWAERWISVDPRSEAAYRCLMTSYHALGDQGNVILTYERCATALREIGLEPSEQTRALAFVKNSRSNIPVPMTSFIGREKELSEITAFLSKFRLVTLTGPGGMGKTRLSIQVASEVRNRFPDGIWFLDLGSIGDPALVPDTVAGVVGLREPQDTQLATTALLINYFRPRRALVIFDNCEHLMDACAALINSLLTSCELLSILATSREALRISSEIPYRVRSLQTGTPDHASQIEVLMNSESVRLFTERARAISPGFVIDNLNVHTIAQICKRLDGIPLAIELAAARVNMLTADQILRRLDNRFNLLTRGSRVALSHHQALRATLEWSYRLLSEQERVLFRRLAVFKGGWTLEASEAICGQVGGRQINTPELLDSLVERSLVFLELNSMHSEMRFDVLETVQQFALEKLAQSGEEGQVRARHLGYFLKKAEDTEPFLMGAQQSAWMDYLDQEFDNMRLALEWSISNQKGEEAFRLFGSLTWFCYIHCHCREGLEWFTRLQPLTKDVSKRMQAKAIGGAGWLNYAIGDLSAASFCHQESAALYRELGDQQGVSTQLQFAGVVEFGRGNRAQARPLLEESLGISRKINNQSAMPRVLMHLGFYAETEGDYATAWQYYEEGLAICREIEEGHLTMVILGTMGSFVRKQKDLLRAREYYKESLEIGMKLKNKRTVAEALLDFAELLCVEERYSESARLHGFAENLFSESESLTESHVAQINQIADVPKKCLGEDSYQKEFDIGKRLRLDEAVEIAMR